MIQTKEASSTSKRASSETDRLNPAGAARQRPPRGFDTDPSRSIGYLLRDNSKRILRATAKRLKPHGVTLPQYYLLREIWREDGPTQRALSQRVGIAEPTIALTLDLLERNGFVTRSRNTEDRRKSNVLLTDQGRELREVAYTIAADVLDKALVRLSDTEVESLRSLLQRMKSSVIAD